MTVFNGVHVDPVHEGERLTEGRVAEVYCGERDYARTTRWNTPGKMVIAPQDHLDGVAWRECQDCGGTGKFPVPWNAAEAGAPSDFCTACKGRGIEPVMV